MENYTLAADEVILYEGAVINKSCNESVLLTLTSQRMILEKDVGIFKKTREVIDIVELNTIKFYNDEVQVKQKMSDVEIQTTAVNLKLAFSGIFEARKFTGKIIDAATQTTLAKRVSEKAKKAFDLVDDTLEMDTRGTIKGVFEKGVKGTLLTGINFKNKKQ